MTTNPAANLAAAAARLLGQPDEHGERRIDPFALGDRLTELAMALDEYERAGSAAAIPLTAAAIELADRVLKFESLTIENQMEFCERQGAYHDALERYRKEAAKR